MLQIVKDNTFRVSQEYRDNNKLVGFNLTLFRILMNSHNRIIKLEGTDRLSGNKQHYWDIISVKEGKLEYYHSYAPTDLGEYDNIQADLMLKGKHGLLVEMVVRLFLDERGFYR